MYIITHASPIGRDKFMHCSINTNKSKCSKFSDRGFTLVELLLSISLLAISIGISSDIIVTLVRTYGKAQVYNDTEQVVNFVFLKMQNDLKSSSSARVEDDILYLSRATGNEIAYSVISYDGASSSQLYRNGVPMLDTTSSVGNVEISCVGVAGACFEVITDSPTTIKVSLGFSQSTGAGIFSTSLSLEDAFVVRGTY